MVKRPSRIGGPGELKGCRCRSLAQSPWGVAAFHIFHGFSHGFKVFLGYVFLHEIYNCEFYMDFWRFMNGSSLKIMFFLRFLLIILDRRSKACRHCSSDGRTGRGQLLAGQNFPRNAFDFELVECQSLDRPGGNEEK